MVGEGSKDSVHHLAPVTGLAINLAPKFVKVANWVMSINLRKEP